MSAVEEQLTGEAAVEPSNGVAGTAQAAPEIRWDGRLHSYRPSPDWASRISPDLSFYDDVDDDLDPVTFEVIRNRLWTMNLAHGETLTRISGSPIFQALDFNMAIMTDDGEIVMNAPYLQCLVAGVPLAVRYILENFSSEPGIEDGDMFLGTDPWVGAVHQMDVLIACPVFIDGKLFGWVSNAGHQYDLGGIVPGGWPQNAPDIFSEPVCLTPFKIIEGGKMRTDLELMYRRQSRMPDLVALDLRAQLAGARFAASQLREICEQFGAPTVKAAMRRILDNAQRSFRQKLSQIPDGRWSDVGYFDEKMPGDRTTHRMQINTTKKGDRVSFDNAGTDPQADGPLNFVYAAYSGQILGALAVTTLYEQMFSIGGAERQIDFEPEPGLLTCADYPAAVSGGVNSIVSHTNNVMQIVARMLTCAPDLKRDVIVGGPAWPLMVLAGVDDRDTYFGTGLMDPLACGSGARSYRDGVDTAGPTWSPLSKLLNVESQERFYPILYLYREELADGGGAGRWRGGTGMKFAFMPYRAKSIQAITNTGGMGVSAYSSPGLFGGYPAPTVHYKLLKETNLDEVFARREGVTDVDLLEAKERSFLRGKSNGAALLPGDVMEVRFVGGGGYGDPLQREPALVAADVALGYVSAQAAEEVYGVVLAGEEVDSEATSARRQALIAERAGWRAATELPAGEVSEEHHLSKGENHHFTPATHEEPRDVHEYVVSRDEDGRRVLACKSCGHRLGDYTENYKLGLLVDESAPSEMPLVDDHSRFLDEDIVFRRYCCPGCQVLMTTEVVRRGEPALPEMMFAPPAAPPAAVAAGG